MLTLDAFRSRFLLQQPARSTRPLSGRPAAVLVPVVARPAPGLLLTQRSPVLRKHAGQVAFPGGRQDDSDRSLVATALREAQEEIGLDPRQVEILGVLPAVASSSGFQVTPVLGIIPATHRLTLNPDEVSHAFEMPLADALQLSRYSLLEVQRAGQHHKVWLSRYQDFLVWGMTAGIIRALSAQIAC